MEVWSTARPRSAMSSSKSRRLRQNRRYQRTQVTITSGSNLRFQNNGGREDLIASPYQIRNTQLQHFRKAASTICLAASFSVTSAFKKNLSQSRQDAKNADAAGRHGPACVHEMEGVQSPP